MKAFSTLVLFLASFFGLYSSTVLQDPPTEDIPSWLDTIVPPETMPAGSIPTSPTEEDAPVPGLPSRTPWVSPGEAGVSADMSWHTNKWGWNIPAEMPAENSNKSLSASNNAIVNTHYSGPGGPIDWRDSMFYGSPEYLGAPILTRWGWIVFDTFNAKWVRCTWHTLYDEHGIYDTGWGRQEFVLCLWEDVYGQAIQHVFSHPDSKRKSQTGLNPQVWMRLALALKDDPFIIKQCETINVGQPQNSERASYVFSFFEPNGKDGPVWRPVIFTQNRMETEVPWIDVNGILRDSGGALMVHNSPWVEVSQNYVVHRKPDRGFMEFWRCETVIIKANYLLSNKAIDIRLSNPETDIVVIRRNRGTTEVVISTNEWYVWESNGWDESKVLYRGPISQNFRWN